jgi:hypothetical protein
MRVAAKSKPHKDVVFILSYINNKNPQIRVGA